MMEFVVIFALLTVLALLCAAIVLIILMLLGDIVADVPYVPVPHIIATRIASLIASTNTSVLYELGCGDGRVVRAVAHACPHALVRGVEKAPLPALLALIQTPRRLFPHVRYSFKDLRDVSLRDASCVYMYLLPDVVQRLQSKLFSELVPGTRIISCNHPLTERTPLQTEAVETKKRTYTLYVYEV